MPTDASPAQRATVGFMVGHPARWIALGFGSGLSPWAPGTVGTLWGWLAFVAIDPWLSDSQWAAVLLLTLGLAWWACTRTAQHLGVADPAAVVVDEVLGIWLVMWLVTPAGWAMQVAAFILFRWFDAAKPGPVRWADRLFKQRPDRPIRWPQGLGILLDDLVAALCTLLVIALWKTLT